MKSWILLCLLLTCYVQIGQGTFVEFVNHIPSNVAHGFDVAWSSLVDSIKNTVQTRRLGPAKKRRATTKVTTSSPSSTTEYEVILAAETTSAEKLTLPVISIPEYTSMKEWIKMQRPKFPTKIPKTNSESDFSENSLEHEANTVVSDRIKENDEKYHGSLMFI